MNIVASINFESGAGMGYIVKMGNFFYCYDSVDSIIRLMSGATFDSLEDALAITYWCGELSGAKPVSTKTPNKTAKEKAVEEPLDGPVVVEIEPKAHSFVVSWVVPTKGKDYTDYRPTNHRKFQPQTIMFVELKRIMEEYWHNHPDRAPEWYEGGE